MQELRRRGTVVSSSVAETPNKVVIFEMEEEDMDIQSSIKKGGKEVPKIKVKGISDTRELEFIVNGKSVGSQIIEMIKGNNIEGLKGLLKA